MIVCPSGRHSVLSLNLSCLGCFHARLTPEDTLRCVQAVWSLFFALAQEQNPHRPRQGASATGAPQIPHRLQGAQSLQLDGLRSGLQLLKIFLLHLEQKLSSCFMCFPRFWYSWCEIMGTCPINCLLCTFGQPWRDPAADQCGAAQQHVPANCCTLEDPREP